MADIILEQLGPVDRWTRYVEPFAGSLAVLHHARRAGYGGDVVIAERHPMIRAFLGGMAEDPESIADVLATLPRVHITARVYDEIGRRSTASGPARRIGSSAPCSSG